MAAIADITLLMGRIAEHERKGRHVLRHYASRANHGILAHGDAADQCGIGPDARAPADARGGNVLFIPDKSTRIQIIGEGCRRAYEDIVLDDHALINGDEVLDLHIAADLGIDVDVNALSYVAVLADLRALAHMSKVPDLCALTNHLALDYGRGMDIVAIAFRFISSISS